MTSPSSSSRFTNPPKSDDICDRCGAPSTWADEWTKNLSWKDSMRLHITTYLTSPRMWPVGYIIASPYSPLHVERQIPARNWRDSFEDLLALESGGQMIRPDSRKKEAEAAARFKVQSLHDSVSAVNKQLERDDKYMKLLQRMLKHAISRNDRNSISVIENIAMPSQRRGSEQMVADGKCMIATLKEIKMDLPASSYKMRGQWITSLVSSGALQGWQAQLYDSADGFEVGLSKTSNPPEDPQGNPDGQQFTELELQQLCEEGKPLEIGSPAWSTARGQYPSIDQNDTNISDAIRHDNIRLPTIRPSILTQLTTTERTTLPDGSITTKVVLKNSFTDDKVEEKVIIDDAVRGLEEVDKAHTSMRDRKLAVSAAAQEMSYEMQRVPLELSEGTNDVDY